MRVCLLEMVLSKGFFNYMAKRRLINTKFWSDSFIVKLLPLERYLFLYLLTNEHTGICGIYELPLEVMSRGTGLPSDTLSDLIIRFNNKIYYTNGWVYIKNFTKNQCANESMIKGAKRSLSEIPPEILAKIKQNNTPSDTLSDPPTPPEILKLKLKPKPKPKPIGIAETSSAEEIIPNLLNDKQKHIQIIGLWARAKKITFTGKAHQQSFIRRNLRAAQNLVPYDINRIMETMVYLIKNADFKSTLESVGKFIDEDLTTLGKKIINLDNI